MDEAAAEASTMTEKGWGPPASELEGTSDAALFADLVVVLGLPSEAAASAHTLPPEEGSTAP